MHTEFEIKFANTPSDIMRQKIQALGGTCTRPLTLMKRVVFSHPTEPHSYLRIRDEGGRITTTLKSISDNATHMASVKEIECVVSDFESIRSIYLAMGLEQKSYQETKREIWDIDNEIEFMLDEWPGISQFIEIEGADGTIIRKYVKLLGLDYNDGLFGAVDQLYETELGIPRNVLNNATPIITFDNPPKRYAPPLLPEHLT